jgi:tRNA pseudouridine55 synthase
VRVLVEDIAKRAGTVAHTVRLHRESVEPFAAADMVDLATIETCAEQDRDALRAGLLPPDVALLGLPAVEIGAEDGLKFCGGQVVTLADSGATGLVRVYAGQMGFLGVGELSQAGSLAPRRVFKSSEKTL